MVTDRPWARHYQEEWQRRAGDDRFPYWLRVAALAYGSHLDNGHAKFKRGEIGLILGKPGEPYTNVTRAIEDAIQYEWLSAESYWGCLVVPEHAVKKGPMWRHPACAQAQRHARARGSLTTVSERFGVPPLQPVSGSEGRTAHSVSGSEPDPLSSVLSPTTNREPDNNRESA